MERSNYFLSFKEACSWAQENCGYIHTYCLNVGPQEPFNVEEVKKRTGANAVVVFWEVENWINNRFEILDL